MESIELTRLLREADSAYKAKRYADAADLYGQAAATCRSTGDPLRAAELENNRSVALLQGGNPTGALQAAQGTDAVFAQAGRTREQAFALGNQASALEELGRAKEALECYRRCSELLKAAGENEQRSLVLGRISALELRKGHALEAITAMDVALENKKKLSLRERLLHKILDIPFQLIRRK